MKLHVTGDEVVSMKIEILQEVYPLNARADCFYIGIFAFFTYALSNTGMRLEPSFILPHFSCSRQTV